jgi:hypothetical protein
MYFAYIDESGDPGLKGSKTFTLACLLLEDRNWLAAFDGLLESRRQLRLHYGLPVRAEVKANHILGNRGAFAPIKLTEAARLKIYRRFITVQAQLGIKTFAIMIRKDVLPTGTSVGPRFKAWDFLLQRLERFSTKNGVHVMIVHDEGEGILVRSLARKSRRAGIAGQTFGFGQLKRPFKLLLDDPISRDSKQSYFVQLADLNAYAAFRRLYPPPPRLVTIVPMDTWNRLGTARLSAANSISGGPPGIVCWPKM